MIIYIIFVTVRTSNTETIGERKMAWWGGGGGGGGVDGIRGTVLGVFKKRGK